MLFNGNNYRNKGAGLDILRFGLVTISGTIPSSPFQQLSLTLSAI
jgi:hypothetical protein